MALADLEKKIITDAKRTAAAIVHEAEAAQQEALSEGKQRLKKERKHFVAEEALRKERFVQQTTAALTAKERQVVLTFKRQLLQRLAQEAMTQLLRAEDQYMVKRLMPIAPFLDEATGFVAAESLSAVRTALQKLGVTARLESRADWARGQVVFETTDGRYDCSLAQWVNEVITAHEAVLSAKLTE